MNKILPLVAEPVWLLDSFPELQIRKESDSGLDPVKGMRKKIVLEMRLVLINMMMMVMRLVAVNESGSWSLNLGIGQIVVEQENA